MTVPESPAVRARLVIRGKVQRVFFRACAAEEGKRLRLLGWVRNRPDGSVELVAQGARESVDALIAWCRVGPPRARVDAVEVFWEESLEDFTSFSVEQ